VNTAVNPIETRNPLRSRFTPPPRKRLRGLSVRMLMLVVLVVGGWLGWVCYRARVQREAVAAIMAAGGEVYYDWEWDSATLCTKPRSPCPGSLRRLLGPGFFEEVAVVYFDRIANENLLLHIGRLRQVQALGLLNSNVTNAGMAYVGAITTLHVLELEGTEVTDEGVKHLGRLTGLQWVNLRRTRITDAGLATIGRLTNLEDLLLDYNTEVTDAGLLHLTDLTRCKISLTGTGVTPSGIAILNAKYPWMEIVPPLEIPR
jgi:hypothetical protein